MESSPGILAVILELTENARDNATEISLTIEVDKIRLEKGKHYLKPKKFLCEDNGAGLTHAEFLNRFCAAFADSESHHETDRAGRNGVGTKTYLSIARRVLVTTTTGRETEGLDEHREVLSGSIPSGLAIPLNGGPDTLWRKYEFKLHNRGAIPHEWSAANPYEMGTKVELVDLLPGVEICYESLIERLSYCREWLNHGAHKFTVSLTGNLSDFLKSQRSLVLRPWVHPTKNWLTQAQGRSDRPITIFDRTTNQSQDVAPPRDFPGILDMDFRVVGRAANGQMQTLEEPALLLEIAGALPYAPNLEGTLSSRTLPLLTFLGLEHASSIGAFCNTICGYARINAMPLKEALRNNKTTLASGPGTESVEALRRYLAEVLGHLHRAWYNATRLSIDDATSDAVREAAEEVNCALKGVNKSPFKGGDIQCSPPKGKNGKSHIPTRRHRWECGACGKRWLAEAGYTPKVCAEINGSSGKGDGCGSKEISLSKNQPRIADCDIRIEELGDGKLPAVFQFEKAGEEVDLPIVRVNLKSPRYIELRGIGLMSGVAQKKLKQYLVDVSLASIAEFYSKTKGTDFVEEWGELYFNRMLRLEGIKEYQSQLEKVLGSTTAKAEEKALRSA
jgi:hypothetical protein